MQSLDMGARLEQEKGRQPPAHRIPKHHSWRDLRPVLGPHCTTPLLTSPSRPDRGNTAIGQRRTSKLVLILRIQHMEPHGR